MLITRLRLKNWRNFRDVEVSLGPRGYVIGANASGKSNLLDAFRFLRTIAQSEGGGLQKAVKERGGLSKLRSLLKHSDEISGRIVENDPFGQGLLQRIARTPEKTRKSRLRRIQQALVIAVPQFSELEFEQDETTGAPHLKANFKHWRVHGSWQREDQFSDGTLRLIGFLWALQEGEGLLLLEEPELSLNDAIVEHLPLMVDRVLKDRKKGPFLRQVLSTTHSQTLIANVVDPTSVLILEPGSNGTTIRIADAEEQSAMENGLNPAEVLLGDRRAVANYFQVPLNVVPRNPDDLQDPKREFLRVVKRSGRRRCRDEMITSLKGEDRVGVGYNVHMREFVETTWNAAEAEQNSPSLHRAMEHVRTLAAM